MRIHEIAGKLKDSPNMDNMLSPAAARTTLAIMYAFISVLQSSNESNKKLNVAVYDQMIWGDRA